MPTEAPPTERANALIPAVGAASCSGIALVSRVLPGWSVCCLLHDEAAAGL